METGYVSLHNHTTFCDGRDTMEDMVRWAAEHGVGALGFSGHSWVPGGEDYCMSRCGAAEYRAELLRLRAAYGERIRLYLGIEQDLFSPDPAVGYDFVIGASHYVERGGRLLSVDGSEAELRANVRDFFGGDFYAFAGGYYAAEAALAGRPFDIVAHFDLVTKFNEGGKLFSEDDPRYLGPALEAMEALAAGDRIFEMNSGAVSRGYRTAPYIAAPLLRALRGMGGRVTLSADAHRKEDILFRFGEMAELLRSCGFSEVWQFGGGGFVPRGL